MPRTDDKLPPILAKFGMLIAFFLFPVTASAQLPAANTVKPKSASYYGFSEAQIGDQFGKPDDIRKKSTGAAEWLYGQSTIFFFEGKVTAWSDAGELAQRAQLNSYKRDKTPADDALSDQWENPWTPPKKGKPQTEDLTDVLDR